MKDAIDHYGNDMQITQSIEKLSELIHALCKYKTQKSHITFSNVIEEIADVQFMLMQLKLMFPSILYGAYMANKIERLETRLRCKKNES